MGAVNLENLYKRYDDVTAVNDVSLDVEDGEFVTLVGPSGCGKSTTLEMIAGLTAPSEGSVHIAGRDVTRLPPKDRGIAMVFQNIALFPHMDVYDNISFGLRLRDFDREEIDRRVERAAEIVQLEGMLDRMPDELSGGQRQRVAIGRAIVREPEVFLMDEPLANLDAALRVHMRTELQRLHRELDATIVYVTHDQEEAMTMSNRLAVMSEGEVRQYADPLTCYREPADEFVAGFIGSPSMNLFDAEVTDDGLATEAFAFDLAVDRFDLAPGRQVRLGIRPEHVGLSDADVELADPTDPIPARVDVIEPVGDEVFVYLQLAADGADVGGEAASAGGEAAGVGARGEAERTDAGAEPASTDVSGRATETDAGGRAAETDTGGRTAAADAGGSATTAGSGGDADGTEAFDDDVLQLLMSIPPDPSLTDDLEGRTVRIRLDRTGMHLFDPESGEALHHGLSTPPERPAEAGRDADTVTPAGGEGESSD